MFMGFCDFYKILLKFKFDSLYRNFAYFSALFHTNADVKELFIYFCAQNLGKLDINDIVKYIMLKIGSLNVKLLGIVYFLYCKYK